MVPNDAASKWNLPGSLYEGLLSDILIGGTCISILDILQQNLVKSETKVED
jgi:hypothetical protein